MSKEVPDHTSAYLVQSAIECGLCLQSGMGQIVTTWQEIKAWQIVTGKNDKWLAQVVRELSISYVTECNLATDPTRASPLKIHIDVAEQRKKVSQQFHNIFKKR